MSIQRELDHVRKQKFAKDMQSVYNKLNELCLQLADMRLEDFTSIMEEYNLNLDDDDQDKWINQPPPWYYNEDY